MVTGWSVSYVQLLLGVNNGSYSSSCVIYQVENLNSKISLDKSDPLMVCVPFSGLSSIAQSITALQGITSAYLLFLFLYFFYPHSQRPDLGNLVTYWVHSAASKGQFCKTKFTLYTDLTSLIFLCCSLPVWVLFGQECWHNSNRMRHQHDICTRHDK